MAFRSRSPKYILKSQATENIKKLILITIFFIKKTQQMSSILFQSERTNPIHILILTTDY